LAAFGRIDALLNDRVLSLVQEQIDVGLAHRRAAGQQHDGDTGRRPRPTYLAARGTPLRRTIWPDMTASPLQVLCHPMFGHSSETRRTSRFRLVVGTAAAACDAASAGIGIASVFSYHVKTSVERGALTTLLDEFQPAPLPVHLVYTANRFLPIKVRAFLDFAAPRLKRVFAE
jgi:DNA-binding transcriptional LysR family regulator